MTYLHVCVHVIHTTTYRTRSRSASTDEPGEGVHLRELPLDLVSSNANREGDGTYSMSALCCDTCTGELRGGACSVVVNMDADLRLSRVQYRAHIDTSVS